MNDYQRRGERFVKNLADDLERELRQYTATAGARHDDELKKTEELSMKVTKSLQRQPKAETLAKQLEERQRVRDERMKEAMSLCEQSTD